jgi:osmotically-inducible protein OsmY
MKIFNKKPLLFVAVIFGLNAATAYGNYPSTNTNQRADQRTSDGHFISDQDIQKAIHDKLGPGWFSSGYEQVSAQVYNGNVTLQGSVKTAEDKEKVEKEIRNLNGVKNLNSQITVQDPNAQKNPNPHQGDAKAFPQDTAASPADDQLNKKIRDNVSRGWLWNSYKEVRLNTNNGNVSLEGTVKSPSDQQKLVDEVQKVEGVRAVKSNLHIKN